MGKAAVRRPEAALDLLSSFHYPQGLGHEWDDTNSDVYFGWKKLDGWVRDSTRYLLEG